MNGKFKLAWTMPLLLAGWLVAGMAQADDPPRPVPGMPGSGCGSGMMGGGYGPGMMGGGYGPGMMGGGVGPGMMGGGFGPGMMGGGVGPGMMGGGFGPGMMEPWWALDLNDKQRASIGSIMDEQHKTNWPLMGRLYEEQNKLHELYRADKWDGDAITKAYDRLFKVQRDMIEASIKNHNRIMEQLTPEQREQLKQQRYHWRNQY